MGRSIGLLILVAALAVAAPSGVADDVRITGFAMDLPGSDRDDAVWLRNDGDETVDLSRYEMADNAGAWAFPAAATIEPGEEQVVAGTAHEFESAAGRPPDYAASGLDAAATMRPVRGSFGLAAAGDRVVLSKDGEVLDVVVYGESASVAGWAGEPVSIRGGSFLRWIPRVGVTDHDDATDWDVGRRWKLGEDLHAPQAFNPGGTVVAYAAPEASRSLVVSTILAANESIRVNVYQFRDFGVAEVLARQMERNRNLSVDVLLDELPVGESREELDERARVVARLTEAGARVRFLPHHRYVFNHAKYLVVDQERVLVQSENLVPSGVPRDGESGNRGWGVVLSNPELARAVTNVFDGDFRLRDYGARDPTPDDLPRFPPALGSEEDARRPRNVARTDAAPRVTLLVAPFQNSGPDDPIVEAIQRAVKEILVAQLDFPPRWRDATGESSPHPYVVALREAAERGVKVRVLLDGHFIDRDDPDGSNAETVATVEGLGLGDLFEARLQGGDRPVLHAKSMVVDDQVTLVGSMNWNANSLLQNRELGALVENPTVAIFFHRIFDEDWQAASTFPLPAPSVATVLTLLLLAAAMGARRR